MAGKVIRGAIVGASTLLGKELADELNDGATAAWDLTLLDTGVAGGTITSAGDEALVIQPVSREAFSGKDIIFFAGERSTALEYWQAAHLAGAGVVDLTGALEGQPHTLVRSPLVSGGAHADLTTVAEVSAHPVAAMLAAAAAQLLPLGLKRMAATVLQPASEAGEAGVQEVHTQTVGLLSFQQLNKEIYDAQVAFNILASLGEAAKVDLEQITRGIEAQVAALTPNLRSNLLAIQVLQAPVFHGYTASIFVELEEQSSAEAIGKALSDAASPFREDDSPSNETAAGKGDILFRIAPAGASNGSAFWLWTAADNLRLAARNAAACALELAQLKPAAEVQ